MNEKCHPSTPRCKIVPFCLRQGGIACRKLTLIVSFHFQLCNAALYFFALTINKAKLRGPATVLFLAKEKRCYFSHLLFVSHHIFGRDLLVLRVSLSQLSRGQPKIQNDRVRCLIITYSFQL